MKSKILGWAMVFAMLAAMSGFAQTYTGESSNRVTINLGASPWKFTKTDPAGGAQATTYSDAAWKDVGIPHTYNDTDTFINQASGGGDGSMFGSNVWYRKHFTIDNSYSGRKVFVEFQGVHIGCQVYINGTFLPGNSAVTADATATHVIGFQGFVVDVTPDLNFGGADNVLAVRVGKNGGFFENPGFSTVFRFGSEDGGIFRPVFMYITDKVHVPMNSYSTLSQWGTYVATTNVSADGSQATVRMLTNVRNDNAAAQNVSVTTKVVDATNTVVLTQTGTGSVNAGQSTVFDQNGTVTNPHLWYPNNSTFGGPYMYTVYHIVQVGGTTVDVCKSPLGIRTITWDANFPYINGHKHLLYGASARYDYPALGTALPPEIEYRDALLLTKCGGNLWRPGHSACSPGFVYACDNTGVMLMQPSGEGEGQFSTGSATADQITLKEEMQRDGVIRDRNNPSILAWEVSNGNIDPNTCNALRTICTTWDSLSPRVISVRGNGNGPKDILSCTVTGCEIGVKGGNPGNPAWGAEAWGGMNMYASQRAAYDYEIEMAQAYLMHWKDAKGDNCFGLCQWYMAETPGEDQQYADGTPGNSVRSFGCSMMDFNRLPKMLYKMYAACWIPYSIKPVVYLAHHWNRSGAVRVNAFSNCATVDLLLNGTSLGKKTPNPWNGTGDDYTFANNTNTELPFQCYWDNVTWAAGTLLANGLDANGTIVCSDQKQTAGNPDHIVLVMDTPVVQANGDTFQITANGTDAALILAKVVDANGITCPTASNIVTFSVSGPGNYRGGSDQMVTAGQPLGYHSPLDPNLSAEGGMCKVAVRSTFTPGAVTVTATSSGLGTGTASFTVVPVPNNGIVDMVRPALRAPAASTMPALDIRTINGVVRYYISRPAVVSMEILDARGRMLERISNSRVAAGWHPIAINGTLGNGKSTSAGIWFVRLDVDGGHFVRQVLLVR
jgi:hypothetical protein